MAGPRGRCRDSRTGLGDVRLNDCRADPQGRLWAGTMSRSRTRGAGALYRLTKVGLAPVIRSTTMSNGLGWSPSGDRMYFIDSVTQRIDVFDFDGATGAISDRRGFADIPAAIGLPDGLVVDVEGGIWVCLFGGGAIRRYSEDGRLTEHLELPVTNPTCPAFGGPGLRDLYITSARHRLTDAQLAKEPHAGASRSWIQESRAVRQAISSEPPPGHPLGALGRVALPGKVPVRALVDARWASRRGHSGPPSNGSASDRARAADMLITSLAAGCRARAERADRRSWRLGEHDVARTLPPP